MVAFAGAMPGYQTITAASFRVWHRRTSCKRALEFVARTVLHRVATSEFVQDGAPRAH
jgi:hypothetical protein